MGTKMRMTNQEIADRVNELNDGVAIAAVVPTEYESDYDRDYIVVQRFSISDTLPYESFDLSEESRHGQNGYRVMRYTWNVEDEMYSWDESYQFYVELGDFVSALKTGNYFAGVKAF